MSSPSILILSFSNLATDPRVNRQIRLLRSDFHVTAAGFADPVVEGVEYVALPQQRRSTAAKIAAAAQLKLGRFASYYWSGEGTQAALTALRGRAFDLIVANDSSAWPLAIALRGNARVLFDAHEYTPREFEDLLWWRIFHQPYKTWLCREYLRRADGVLTVCPGIAEEYEKVFGVRPAVVRNVPPQQSLAPSPVDPSRVRMIHHGGATASRKIETMIGMLDQLDDRFSLDLILVPTEPRYLARLQELGRGQPKVRFLPPVSMREIPAFINRYDLGLYLLEPNSFNNLHALPNKFFEFIQARLGVAIGPSPEMARLVREHACGVVAEDFSPVGFSRALAAVTPTQIETWKQNAHRAADVLCWENESAIFQREIERLLALGPCAA